MEDELIYQTFINKLSRLRRFPSGERRRARAAVHGELTMTQQRGDPRAATRGNVGPAGGPCGELCSELNPGGGTGLGKAIAAEFARLGADVSPAGRAEHLGAGKGGLIQESGPVCSG